MAVTFRGCHSFRTHGESKKTYWRVWLLPELVARKSKFKQIFEFPEHRKRQSQLSGCRFFSIQCEVEYTKQCLL